MKVLYFAESYGNATFITSQFLQAASLWDSYFICNYNYATSHTNEKVIALPLIYSVVAGKFRDRLEMHGIYLSFYNRDFSRRLRQEVDQISPDVIHLQFGYEAIRFLDNYVTKKIPIVIHFRGYDASKMLRNRAYVRKLEKYLQYGNVWPVCVSNSLVENIYSAKILAKNKPVVLFSNTDCDFFRRSVYQRALDQPFTLVQVSTFRVKKGHKYSLLALKKYIETTGDQNIRMIFTGAKSGDNFEQVRHLCFQLGLDNYVVFTGQTTVAQTKKLYEAADCAILHSITTDDGDMEGVPNTLMEAMAMELPVIASVHSGIPELATEGTFSKLVPEKDIANYAAAIADVKLNWRWAPENRERVLRGFSKQGFITKLSSLYETIQVN